MTVPLSDDELLDRVVAEIRSQPVPECPSGIFSEPDCVPGSVTAGGPSFQRWVAVGVAVACLVLLAAGLVERRVTRDGAIQPVARLPEHFPSGNGEHVFPQRSPAEVNQLRRKLDQLDQRLQQVEEDIALRELHREFATVLAHYQLP